MSGQNYHMKKNILEEVKVDMGHVDVEMDSGSISGRLGVCTRCMSGQRQVYILGE